MTRHMKPKTDSEFVRHQSPLGMALVLMVLLLSGQVRSDETVATVTPVNAMNYVRAKTALQFNKYNVRAGGINRFFHTRDVINIENQSSRRLNRDTLYSSAIIDISRGADVFLPESDDRYMSMQVINEEGYTNAVYHDSGRYHLTLEEFDTRFVWLLVRILVSPSIPGDIEIARSLQDGLSIESESSQPYHHPTYDADSFHKTTHHLIELAKGLNDNSGAAGPKGEIDPIKQLLASAYGFGTLPQRESFLIVVEPNLPADRAYSLTVEDVPVDGFWSLAMYDADGYFTQNEYSIYGYSDRTATQNPDGSITLHFGGDPSSVNYIPISDGWNYVVRLYQPREEVLDGSWVFPAAREVGK